MDYSDGDLDMLEEFYRRIDFGKTGVEFHRNGTIMTIDKGYFEDRLRLMRLNLSGAAKENYGVAWFENMMAFKEYFTDEASKNRGNA